MTFLGNQRGNYRVKVKSMSIRNTQTINSPWYRAQNTPNEILVSAGYFPVFLRFNLQTSLELDMEMLLTPFQHCYL